MACVIVASNESSAGKSSVAAALLREAAARDLSTSYFKPFGTAPVSDGGPAVDQDAEYLTTLSTRTVDPRVACPIVLDAEKLEDTLTGRASSHGDTVRSAYQEVSRDADLVVVEGPQDLAQGSALGLDAASMADMASGRVLLVFRPGGSMLPEPALLAQRLLGDAFLGVILNDVRSSRADEMRTSWTPFLERHGVRVWGVMPHDDALSSVTIADIRDALEGTILCAEERLDRPVESFMVGAMGRDKALRYFRRRARKAVVTGGDRSDVQLAALDTDTTALVLTGGFPPSSRVLGRAEELDVPVILVTGDTLSAVEGMEALFGRVRIHDPAKVARIREMLVESTDVDELLGAIGL